MTDQKRGNDAGDHAPKPHKQPEPGSKPTEKQDAENYDDRTDGDRALKDENLSSANDE